MDFTELGSAGVSAGGSVLSGLLGGIGSIFSSRNALKAQRETNQMNYKIWQEQRQAAIDQWNRENQYNTPSAQRARLEEAGYNPLNITDVSGNTSASSTVPEAPDMVAPSDIGFQNAFTGIGQGILQGLQTFGQFALGSAANSREDEKQGEVMRGLNVMNDLHSLDLKYGVQNKDMFLKRQQMIYMKDFQEYIHNMQNNPVMRELNRMSLQSKKLEYELGNATKENAIEYSRLQNDQLRSQIALINLDAKSKEILNSFLPAQQQAELALKAASKINLYSQAALYNQQAKTEKEKQDLVRNQARTEIAKEILVSAQAAGQKIDSYVAEATAKELVDALFYKYRAERSGYMVDEKFNYDRLDYLYSNPLMYDDSILSGSFGSPSSVIQQSNYLSGVGKLFGGVLHR